jgi:diacylglycerol O-acyltransferase / wax synthase
MATERLSVLDASFLRVETPAAHMHVAWRGTFAPHPTRPRPTLDAVRGLVAARLELVPRFRRRLAHPALGIGEPYWVDDPDFDVARHVVELADRDERVPLARFRALADRELSRPLPRDRPLWRISLATRLEDDRIGLVCKIHHALVDGKSAVELGLLLFDLDADAEPGPVPDWQASRPPGAGGLALRTLGAGVGDSLSLARGAARALAAPHRGAGRVADTLRRAALALEADVLAPAPPSYLNAATGPRRTLQGHSASLDELMAIRRTAAVTFNDVCLAVVAGALREVALARGETPRPLKAMVPVSVRADAERATLGNRISFAFVELPIAQRSPAARLARVHAQTDAFKRAGRAAGTESVLSAAGLLPPPLRGPAARLAAGPRTYNLAVSNVPGPPQPVHLLGARLDEAFPVVPFPEGHSLSIGVFTYAGRALFGAYGEPDALPELGLLPGALSVAVQALGRAVRRDAGVAAEPVPIARARARRRAGARRLAQPRAG